MASMLVALAAVAGHLPTMAVGTVSLLAAGAVAAEMRVPVLGSRWMVPRAWARLGPTGYAAAFGFALGAGVVTMMPSAALYALLGAAQAAPVWWQSFALLLTFGSTRALLTVLLTARSARRGTHPVERMDWVSQVGAHAATVEAFLAAALGIEVLRAL
jgi:hypothetical protein